MWPRWAKASGRNPADSSASLLGKRKRRPRKSSVSDCHRAPHLQRNSTTLSGSSIKLLALQQRLHPRDLLLMMIQPMARRIASGSLAQSAGLVEPDPQVGTRGAGQRGSKEGILDSTGDVGGRSWTATASYEPLHRNGCAQNLNRQWAGESGDRQSFPIARPPSLASAANGPLHSTWAQWQWPASSLPRIAVERIT